jgi:hypothetical protein
LDGRSGLFDTIQERTSACADESIEKSVTLRKNKSPNKDPGSNLDRLKSVELMKKQTRNTNTSSSFASLMTYLAKPFEECCGVT